MVIEAVRPQPLTSRRLPPVLRAYQLEPAKAIIGSAMDGRGLTFTVVMARQAGKNELSAQIELHLLGKYIQRHVEAVKCAPTFDPQCRISLRRLWARCAESSLEGATFLEGRTVRVGSARQVFLSAEPGANVAGHTASLLLEVDEAQDVDRDKFNRDFRPMAASTGATTVYYGTPWDDSTLLEEAVETNRELERRDGIRRHFEADWSVVAETNAAYGRYVASERARLGEDHPLFRTQYTLKTIAGAGRLFSASQRAQLAGTHSRQSAPRTGEIYVAGLDVGGQAGLTGEGRSATAHDATVLTIARVVPAAGDALVQEPRVEVVEHISFQSAPHDEVLSRVADVAGRGWRVQRLVVDATGLGETIARFLARALGEDLVQPLRFSTQEKSRLGFDLLASVNGGRLRMYAADGSAEYAEFWREADLARLAHRPDRTMNFYVPPAQGHDDYIVSLALALKAARNVPGRPRVARGRIREDAAAV